ncbi:MAG: alpha/beta hydrolase [Thiobacillaceae bacterium]
MRSIRLRLTLLLGVLLGFTQAWAERVTLDLRPGLTAHAEYRPGAEDKPAVLILHGFLQTHNFPTVHNLADGLASAGYSVLTPTLTLGVTHRRQSLSCEAIHTHTHEGNVREIDAWLRWLKARGHRRIVLIGHSLGSAELLLYLQARRPGDVVHFIALSLVESRSDDQPDGLEALRQAMRQRVARGDRSLLSHPLSFCRNFNAAPQTFASYLAITPERLLAAAKGLPIPATFIMGGGDERLGSGWIERLERTGRTVIVIPNASHFLDGEHEFELIDTVLATLKQAA